MRKIHLVIPMGGGGTRFGDKGFNLPKPLIEIHGKPFFFWATQSIVKFVDVEDIIFVVLKEHVDKYNIDLTIKKYYPNAKVVLLKEILNGAVLTCKEGISVIEDNLPILFNDCDHAFYCEEYYKYLEQGEYDAEDAAILTFNSTSDAYSYVMFNNMHQVLGTIEKKVVSEEAICGAYHFKNKTVFLNAVEKYLSECEYNEFYLSGVYNVLAKDEKKIVTFSTDEHISFGTPLEYDEACNNEGFERWI